MKLQIIELNNFGSYESTCSFKLNTEDDKRIVLVGGKNGAGKTTLFTALQVCLYGHYAFGYKSAGKQYFRNIRDLINTNSKLKNLSSAYVRVDFCHVDDTGYNQYKMLRFWEINSGEIIERVAVWKNSKQINDEDLAMFQNYLIHLIPPEMLKLYFFDGEKIADYFLGEQKINIRESLMILSGNDTFDILHDNLKRIVSKDGSSNNEAADTYLKLKAEFEDSEHIILSKKNDLESLNSDILNTEAELQKVNEEYSKKGGITQEQWKNIQVEMKDEEVRRDKINFERKTAATDVLPFIIMKDLVKKIMPLIKAEDEQQMYKFLNMRVEDETFRDRITVVLKNVGVEDELQQNMVIAGVQGFLLDGYDESRKQILCLSEDEKGSVLSVLNRVESFDANSFKQYKKTLEASIENSKNLRTKLQNSSIENFETYLRETTALESKLKELHDSTQSSSEELVSLEEYIVKKEQELKVARKAFEQQLKNDSVNAIAGRTLLMVEELQSQLYEKLIREVEINLNTKLKQLIRKDNFFDKIIIDEDFNVHILRNQSIAIDDLRKMRAQGGFVNLRNTIGITAYKSLFGTNDDITVAEFNNKLNCISDKNIVLQIEVDKNRMSSGEKQVFVMALYWSIMQQSKNDIPFVIDTPFARTDTEHRANITEYFFKELAGQLFILSTNEEISEGHITSMKDQIANTFMLEYGDDKRTHIKEGQFFEV